MPDPDVGPVVGITDATRQLLAHLKAWLPLYLDRVETHLNDTKPAGAPDVALGVKTWLTPITTAQGAPIVADGQLPAVSVVPAGLPAPPVRRGQVWEAGWLLDIVAFARGQSYDHVLTLLGGYVTAVHLAVAQHHTVGDLDWCNWVGEQIEPLDAVTSRTLGTGTVSVNAGYERVVDMGLVPPSLPATPTDPVDVWPTVLTTPLTVDQTVP